MLLLLLPKQFNPHVALIFLTLDDLAKVCDLLLQLLYHQLELLLNLSLDGAPDEVFF